MIRKQLYLASEHERKVRRLAARWGCTEAQVIRTALDQLPDPDASIEGRLMEAGLLVRSPTFDDLPTGIALEMLEREHEVWVAAQPAALGLDRAVMEDRR